MFSVLNCRWAATPAKRRNCAVLYAPPSRRVNPRIANIFQQKTVYLASPHVPPPAIRSESGNKPGVLPVPLPLTASGAALVMALERMLPFLPYLPAELRNGSFSAVAPRGDDGKCDTVGSPSNVQVGRTLKCPPRGFHQGAFTPPNLIRRPRKSTTRRFQKLRGGGGAGSCCGGRPRRCAPPARWPFPCRPPPPASCRASGPCRAGCAAA